MNDYKTQKYHKKELKILDSFKKCLSRSIYANISFDDLSNESNMSKGGIRHYFPTKESLYIGLIENFFRQIENDQISILKEVSQSKDKALLSTMYSFEKFLLDQENVLILMNILLYGFEEKKVMSSIQTFLRKHLELFKEISREINQSTEPENEIHLDTICRYIQIILMTMGLFQYLDPIKIDVAVLVRNILKIMNTKNE